MNQDLGFELTPAKARMLLKASELFLAKIDPIIEQEAKRNIFFREQWTDIEKSLAQFILDTNFRCGICDSRGQFKRKNIVKMLIVLEVKNLIITGQNEHRWNFLHKWPNISFQPVDKLATDSDFQKKTRNDVVIFDWGASNNSDNLEIIAKEYPKSIGYVSRRDCAYHRNRTFQTKSTKLVKDSIFPWWEIGCSLFPNMPRAIFDQSKATFAKKVLYEPTWKKTDVNDIAMMYNVFLPEQMVGYGAEML